MSLRSFLTRLHTSITSTIKIILSLSFLSTITATLIGWTLLLHLNYISFTTPTSAIFYMQLKTLPLLVPIPGNVVVNEFLQSNAIRTLTSFHLIIGVAISVLAVTRSRPVYFIAFAVYTNIQSLRIARVTLLARVSRKRIRTAVLATNQLAVPFGAILVPLAWLLIQEFRSSIRTPFGLIIDRFTLLHVFCASLSFLSAFLASFGLRSFRTEAAQVADEAVAENIANMPQLTPDYGATVVEANDESDDIVRVQLPGRVKRVSISGYRATRFAFYACFMFGVRLSTMVLSNAFQPILIDIFGISEVELGQAYLTVALAAVIPPVLVALMSGRLSDRTIILIGMFLKIVGVAFFMPILGSSKWRVLIGTVLLMKASMFLVPASFSLFTKVMGRLNSGDTSLAMAWSVASIGPAAVQIFMGKELVDWYGSWKYIVFAIPCLISAIMVLSPVGWSWLDHRSEITRAVVAAADGKNVHPHKKGRV